MWTIATSDIFLTATYFYTFCSRKKLAQIPVENDAGLYL